MEEESFELGFLLAEEFEEDNEKKFALNRNCTVYV